MGVPPRQLMDDYPARAAVLGKLQNASHVLCSPQGELFCVRNGDLYRGPMPSSKDVDWFSIAQRVGRGEWSYFKILLFNKNGELYGTTNDGKFYKGPQPNQENNPWMYGQATQIGESAWDQFETLFFHPDGDLYGVNKEDKFVKGRPPTSAKNYWDWLKGSTVVGGCDWLRFTHYMAFTTDGKLWAVDKGNGNIYCGYLLADGRYKDTAERLGWNYNMFPFLSFTTDKIISKITSFKFFPQQAKKLSESLQMIQEETFTNTSSAVLKHTFT
ncbi:hypothetical protein GDO81_026050 [Engystomops pustulosus]|uniref:Tachylectin 2 domain-containing protein n=1 Tax=Engystomops pustulosus TaxID=76066 RepID=A0AAV6YGF0_ENGPU|nr:hypothetical protein GDO81_026050 [Engystomops pustulosus]